MSHSLQFVTCDDGTVDVMRPCITGKVEMVGSIIDRRDLSTDRNGVRFYPWEGDLFRKEELDAISAKMGEFPEVAK